MSHVHHTHSVAAAVVLAAASLAWSQPHEVLCERKISMTQGGFAGPLLTGDAFGRSIAYLGDLNGDGVGDVAVGAAGADDGGASSGAVWILFLKGDGSVAGQQKISNLEGNFPGVLGALDFFGRSMAAPGDLDGDDVPDLAVGAYGDDDGGSGRGAVWILFLNQDGTVKSAQKISATEGNFSGPLENGDRFGYSVAGLGDFNGDGVGDLAVGAIYEDDGASNAGGVWLLMLNADGTVQSHQKISATAGGFAGALGTNNWFGWSVASVGDLDGNAVTDIAVGAVTDDDGGTDRGAVWILFLNSDATVASHQKISDTSGDFDAILHDSNWFGSALAFVGDLAGGAGLAVGAERDNDGGPTRGAVWLLQLTSSGTVTAHLKISDTVGNFGGLLDDDDRFACALAWLGDQDSGGTGDLAVGAWHDDDGGGSNPGAVWMLYLDDPAAYVDCNTDGVADQCELDCDGDGILDECELADCAGDPACGDCNDNAVPDDCDIAAGSSADCQPDGIPDECQQDGEIQCGWIGGTGLWSISENWCPATVPDNDGADSFEITIDGARLVVTLNMSPTLDALTLLNGATIEVGDASGADFRALSVGAAIGNGGVFRVTDRERFLLDAPTIELGPDGGLEAADGVFDDPSNPDDPAQKSILQISSAQVIGGYAQTSGDQSEIHLIAGAELDGVDVQGVVVPDGQSGSFRNTVVNSGALIVAPGGTELATLAPALGGATLQGADGIDDRVALGGELVAVLGSNNVSFTNAANHRIDGAGVIRGGVVNEGVILANLAGQALVVVPLGAKINHGVMGAGGGTLRLDDDVTGSGALEVEDGIIEVSSFSFSAGTVTIGPGGVYRKNPNTGMATAALTADTVRILEGMPGGQPGTMIIEDSMSVTTTGDLILDSTSFGLRGSDTPPDLRIWGTGTVDIGDDFAILGGPASVSFTSPNPVVVRGDIINESTLPEFYDWAGGGAVLNGAAPQTLEVAGEDRGPWPIGLVENFAMASVTVNGTVSVIDSFDNQQDGVAECDEVLYLDQLIVGSGAALNTAGCKIYYGQLDVDDPQSIPGLGIDVLPIAEAIPQDVNGDGAVDVLDLLQVILNWGPVPPGDPAADIDDNGVINVNDLVQLIVNWGPYG